MRVRALRYLGYIWQGFRYLTWTCSIVLIILGSISRFQYGFRDTEKSPVTNIGAGSGKVFLQGVLMDRYFGGKPQKASVTVRIENVEVRTDRRLTRVTVVAVYPNLFCQLVRTEYVFARRVVIFTPDPISTAEWDGWLRRQKHMWYEEINPVYKQLKPEE